LDTFILRTENKYYHNIDHYSLSKLEDPRKMKPAEIKSV